MVGRRLVGEEASQSIALESGVLDVNSIFVFVALHDDMLEKQLVALEDAAFFDHGDAS